MTAVRRHVVPGFMPVRRCAEDIRGGTEWGALHRYVPASAHSVKLCSYKKTRRCGYLQRVSRVERKGEVADVQCAENWKPAS